MLVEHGRAFRRVGQLRAEGAIILPALAATQVDIEVGVQKGVQRAFDRRLARRAFIVFLQRLHPAVAGYMGAPFEDRLEQGEFVLEVIVHQRGVDTDLHGDIAQRHAIETVLGKEIFGRVQNLFQRLGALLGLGPGCLLRWTFFGLRFGSLHPLDLCNARLGARRRTA